MLRKKRQNIILTADDFGKSQKANENILKLASVGKLDRVSVMIEGEFGKNELDELIGSNVKLDIHFELIWQKRRRNILADKALRQGMVFLMNYVWGDWHVPENPRSGVKAVQKEWRGQIKKFKEIFERLPDGISSHEHTHFFPPYFKVTTGLAKEFDIPAIRFGRKGFLGNLNAKREILSILRWIDRIFFAKSKMQTADYFSSLDWIDPERFLEKYSSQSVEIACHPEREEEVKLIEKYF